MYVFVNNFGLFWMILELPEPTLFEIQTLLSWSYSEYTHGWVSQQKIQNQWIQGRYCLKQKRVKFKILNVSAAILN